MCKLVCSMLVVMGDLLFAVATSLLGFQSGCCSDGLSVCKTWFEFYSSNQGCSDMLVTHCCCCRDLMRCTWRPRQETKAVFGLSNCLQHWKTSLTLTTLLSRYDHRWCVPHVICATASEYSWLAAKVFGPCLTSIHSLLSTLGNAARHAAFCH